MTENYPPIDELDELSFRSYAMFVQAKLMPSIFDLKELLEIAIDAFVELLRVNVGYIMLFDEKSRQLSVEAVKGLKRHTIRKTRVNVNKDIIQGIIERKAAIFLSELFLVPTIFPFRITLTRSATFITSTNLWVMKMIEYPNPDSSRTTVINSLTSWGVSTAVGSSKTRIFASR